MNEGFVFLSDIFFVLVYDEHRHIRRGYNIGVDKTPVPAVASGKFRLFFLVLDASIKLEAMT